jgi:hypothetical protein
MNNNTFSDHIPHYRYLFELEDAGTIDSLSISQHKTFNRLSNRFGMDFKQAEKVTLQWIAHHEKLRKLVASAKQVCYPIFI